VTPIEKNELRPVASRVPTVRPSVPKIVTFGRIR